MATSKRNIVAAEHKIEEFAEDLGRMLGHARTKAEGWLGQRRQIVKSLTELRDEASKLLGQLGHDAAVAGRRGRTAVTAAVAGIQGGSSRLKDSPKSRRKLSAKARKAIGDAQRARWAKQKAGETKK